MNFAKPRNPRGFCYYGLMTGTYRNRTLGTACAASLALFAAVAVMRFGAPWFPLVDAWASQKALALQTDALTRVVVLLTDFFSSAAMTVIVAAFGLALWLERRRAYALLLVGSMALGTASFWLLKLAFRQARPGDQLIDVSGYAFPSGHATTAAVLFLSVAYLYSHIGKHGGVRFLFYALCAAMALAVAASRVYLGVHWLSDVAAGLLLGTACFTFALFVIKSRMR